MNMCRLKWLGIKFLRGQFEQFQIRKSVVGVADVTVVFVVVDAVPDFIVDPCRYIFIRPS